MLPKSLRVTVSHCEGWTISLGLLGGGRPLTFAHLTVGGGTDTLIRPQLTAEVHIGIPLSFAGNFVPARQ